MIQIGVFRKLRNLASAYTYQPQIQVWVRVPKGRLAFWACDQVGVTGGGSNTRYRSERMRTFVLCHRISHYSPKRLEALEGVIVKSKSMPREGDGCSSDPQTPLPDRFWIQVYRKIVAKRLGRSRQISPWAQRHRLASDGVQHPKLPWN